MMVKLNGFFEKCSFQIIAFIGLILVLALGLIDYSTGYELSFAFFYLIPVAFVAWYGRFPLALLICILSAFVWHYANEQAGQEYSHRLIGIWNAGTRFGFFVVVSFLFDKLKKALAREKNLSRIDPLTGAANRRFFDEIANLEIKRTKRTKRNFSVAYFDVDNFKKVNDTLGHNIGSELLIKIVESIKNNIRQTDSVARLGGDEFVVLFPETDANQIPVAVEKIRTQLSITMEKDKYPVTFSMGVLTVTPQINSIDEMMKKVDDLMYEVKKTGKNAVRYSAT